LNSRDPITFVRSPTISGRLLSSPPPAHSGKEHAMRGGFDGPGPLTIDHLRNRFDVQRRRAAASTHDVQPAVIDETLQVPCHGFGRFIHIQLLIGSPAFG